MTSLRRLGARLLSRLRSATDSPLAPAEAYRLWARTYGEEPNAFQRLEAPLLDACLGNLRGAHVLDLGTGRGRVARSALEHGAGTVVAADLVLAMHTAGGGRTAEPSQPLALVAPIHPLPFRPATFDLVCCALVLGHEPDLRSAIQAMAAVLRPGGRLVLTDFHPRATARGWQRTLDRAGTSHTIVQHLHTQSDYHDAFDAAGLVARGQSEASWKGQPVVLALEAGKPKKAGLR